MWAVGSGTHPRGGEGWGAELVERGSRQTDGGEGWGAEPVERGSSLADVHQSWQEGQNEVFGHQGQAAEGRPEGALCEEGRDLLTQFWQSRWHCAGGSRPSGDAASAGSGPPGQPLVEILDWNGELCPPLHGAMWSAYYHSHERTPENLELAPWVAGLYARRRKGLAAHQLT